MKPISIEVAQSLPILDQLKILTALANLLSELQKGSKCFAYYDHGIVIEEITSGEYTVSLGGSIPLQHKDDLKRIFPDLSHKIAEQHPELNADPIKNIGDDSASAIIECCESFIKILSNQKEKSEDTSQNESALGLAFKRARKKMVKEGNITTEIPSIHNHKKAREQHRTNTYIMNPHHPTKDGGYSKVLLGFDETKINKMNGRVVSITQDGIKTKYDEEGRIKSVTENGMKTNYYKTGQMKSIKSNGIKIAFNENGSVLSTDDLSDAEITKINQASQIKQVMKLFRNIHPGSKNSIPRNHDLNHKETELFKSFNKDCKGGYLKTSHRDFHGVSILERMEGETLYDYLDNNSKTIDETELCKLLLAAIEALELFHQKKIKLDGTERQYIHCDIKPENILILKNKEGSFTVKFIDVGMAATQNTMRTTASGTPLYTPIEVLQINDKKAKISRAGRLRLKEHDYYSLIASFLLPCLALNIDHHFLGADQELCQRFFESFKTNEKENFPYNFIASNERKIDTAISRLFCWNPSSLLERGIVNSVKQQLSDTIEKNKVKNLSSSESEYDNSFVLFENKRISELKAEVVQKTVIGAPSSPNSSN